MSTRFVYLKFASLIYDKVRLRITDFITTSQMAYSIWLNMNCPEHPAYVNNKKKWVDTWPFAKKNPEADKFAAYRPLPYLKRSNHYIEIPDGEKYDFIKRAVYGGRVYPIRKQYQSSHYEALVNGTMKYEDLTDDYMMNFDVVSLYPTAMKCEKNGKNKWDGCQYPVGNSSWVDNTKLYEFECYFNGNPSSPTFAAKAPVGFWQVYWQAPKNLMVPVLPEKHWITKNGKSVPNPDENLSGLKWSLVDGFGVYSTVDLIQARKAGYTFKFAKGLYYPSGSANIFGSYIDFMWEFKCEGEKHKNDVLRNFGKLCLNALYGKMLQQPILDNIKIIKNKKDMLKFLAKHDIDTFVFMDNQFNTLLVKGTKIEEEKAINKPAQMGAYVLSHSRRIMDTFIYKLDPNRLHGDPLAQLDSCQAYGDTDSIHTHIPNKQAFDNILPDIQANELGMLSNDYRKKDDGKIIKSIYLEPKTYAVQLWTSKNKLVEVKKCKGVPNDAVTFADFEAVAQGKRDITVDMEMIKKVGARNHYRWVTDDMELDHNQHRVVDEVEKEGETKYKIEYKPFEMYSVPVVKQFCSSEWTGRLWLTDGIHSVPYGYDTSLLPAHLVPKSKLFEENFRAELDKALEEEDRLLREEERVEGQKRRREKEDEELFMGGSQ